MSGYTVTLTDSEYDALKARIARLEAALRGVLKDTCGDWNNVKWAKGSSIENAIAVLATSETKVYRSKEEMPDGGYVYGDTQAEADAKVTQANRQVKP
jgi:hypothetical protein